MPKKAYKKRIQFQITIYFVLLAVFIINSVGWFLYFRAEHYFDVELGKKLVGISQSGADFMDAELLTYLKPGDENGSFYQTLFHTLNILKSDFQVTRIYILDRDFKVLVDTQPHSAIAGTIPHLQSNLVELNAGLNGKPVYSTLYRGLNGNLYKSAFSPIKDKTGKVVAIAGVDASPGFLQVIDKIEDTILLINLISMIVAIILSIILARSIVNPIKKLVNAAFRVSRGKLDQPVEISAKNEIGFLGRVFNSMQQNIKTNQEKLQLLKQQAETKADTIQTYNEYILQSIGNGILTIDLVGKITVLNEEAARILRLNHQESIGKQYKTVLYPNHPFYPVLEYGLQSKSRSTIQETVLNYDQSSLTIVATQISPLLDAEQRTIGTNWVLTDITEFRNLQEKVKAKERMAYLGELSAAVAHEIRNPLNSIELFIGLLKRQLSANTDQLKAIDKIQQEIQALNSIVTNFLIFARPGKLKNQSIYLTKLFQEALFLAENELKKKNISVQITVTPDDILFIGDLSQLKQALLNIILNAVQAMADGGTLILFAEEFTTNRHPENIRIRITDSGKGISEGNFEKIFQPFYSTRSQGTGLGLAIVRNIIHAHRGNIFVDSAIDKGTTFTIEIPKKKE